MKSLSVLVFAVLVSLSLRASVPSIPASSVSLEQNPVTRMACLRYTLENGPAVVTADIYTNGVNAGAALLENAVDSGYGIAADGPRINCVIRQDGAHELYFRPAVAGGALLAAGEVTVKVRAWAMDAPPDWMVVDLQTKSNVCYYAERESLPGGAEDLRYKTSKLLMRRIPAKGCTWRMGSPDGETGRASDEDCRYVTLDADYYIGVYELTQAQHSNAYVNAGISYYSGSKQDLSSYKGEDAAVHPFENLAPYYFRWQTTDGSGEPGKEHGKVGNRTFFGYFRPFVGLDFDLPTEAEWEYACRAGTGTAFNNGTDSLSNSGWVVGSLTTKEVGTKDPNGWGLYDCHGNVMEWCLDAYGTTANYICCRGGSYLLQSVNCRSAKRSGDAYTRAYPSYGYRLWAPAVAK